MTAPSNETVHGLDLVVSDVTQQKSARVLDVPLDATVGEVIQRSLDRLRLAQHDSEGRSVTWQARLDREGRRLHSTEAVGTALLPGDCLTLEPNIDAGRGGGS
jgi:hypothetical protein